MTYTHGTARRIVTGLRDDGASVFARTERVEPDYRRELASAGGATVYRMWAVDVLPLRLPVDGLRAPLAGAPAAEETQEALRHSSPLPGEPDAIRASLIEFEPGYVAALHWHDTFDIQWMVAGSLHATLDDGSEVELRPGDCMIAHGANHGWRAGGDGAVIAVVRIGARRSTPSPLTTRPAVHLTPDAVAGLRARTIPPELDRHEGSK